LVSFFFCGIVFCLPLGFWIFEVFVAVVALFCVCHLLLVTFSFEVLVFSLRLVVLFTLLASCCCFSYLREIVSFFLVLESFLFVFSLLLLRFSVLRSVVSAYLIW
jgi:hypothetical protein